MNTAAQFGNRDRGARFFDNIEPWVLDVIRVVAPVKGKKLR